MRVDLRVGIITIIILMNSSIFAQKSYSDYDSDTKISFLAEEFTDNIRNWNLGKFNGTSSKIKDGFYKLNSAAAMADQDFNLVNVDLSKNFEVESSFTIVNSSIKRPNLVYLSFFTKEGGKLLFGYSNFNGVYLHNKNYNDREKYKTVNDFNALGTVLLTLRVVNDTCYAFLNKTLQFKFENPGITGKMGFLAREGKLSVNVDYLRVHYLNERPSIKIMEPSTLKKLMVVTDKLTIRGQVKDDGEINEVKINGNAFSVDKSGNFSEVVKLEKGKQKIEVSASDIFSASTKVELEVFYNDVPSILLEFPTVLDGIAKINSDEIELKGNISDSDGVKQIWVNEKEIQFFSSGDFSMKTKLRIGSNKFLIKAIDSQGAIAEFSFSVERNTPPELTILSPMFSRGFRSANDNEPVNYEAETTEVSQQIAYSTIEEQVISGKAKDIHGISKLLINDTEVETDSNGSFSHSIHLNLGQNNVRIKVFDNKGALSEEFFQIVYDSVSTQGAQKRVALIIGNSTYIHSGSLKNPKNDATAIQNKLRQLGFEVHSYLDLDTKGMKKAVDDFGKILEGAGVGLFFYAGHGIQYNGVNYLVPVNAKLSAPSEIEYDCIDAGRILTRMEDGGTKTNIIILDACRDNPFEQSWSRSTKGKGLANMNSPVGTLLAYATSPGKTASDGTGKNGLYTSALLRHIETPGVSIEEVFKRVRITVMKESGNMQTPWETTSLTGDFYFKRK